MKNKKERSTKQLTITVANKLAKGQEIKMINELSKYIERLYYS